MSCPHSRCGQPDRCSQCAGARPQRVAAWGPLAENSPEALAVASSARIRAAARRPSIESPRALADVKPARPAPAKPKHPPVPGDGSWVTLRELTQRCGVTKTGLDRYREDGRLTGEQVFAGKRVAFPRAIAETFHRWFTARRAA